MNWLALVSGLALLVVGGELLVRGSVTLAERVGMPPLLIGLTLVGFGTSSPELVTSVQAAIAGSPGIAVGNIVGSSIANLLFILGLSAAIAPITVRSSALKRDGVIVVGVAIVFAVVGFTTPLGQIVGLCFLAALAAYLWYAYQQEMIFIQTEHTAAYGRAEAYEELHERLSATPLPVPVPKTRPPRLHMLLPLLMALAGLAILVLGGGVLVDGAIAIARELGISEAVIGLTIVAVGTSMPEFVTSLLAALRKHADVALGNIMGSNIYNVLGIGGVTGVISPTAIPTEIVFFDNPVLVAASLAMLIFALNGRRISRLEGTTLLLGYIVYLWALWPG